MRHVCALLLALAIAPLLAADAGRWSQWRGPQRDGHVGGEPWPDRLASLEPAWRVPLGKGYPGPVVDAKRVFVVETRNERTVAVLALDRRDGTKLWERSWTASGKVPFFAARNGDWVRSTPALEGTTLYVGDMEEQLYALDVETGAVRWTVDFPETFGTGVPDFGFCSSPLVSDGAVFVQAANSLVKLDATDGSVVWRALAGSGEMRSGGAFSSPVLAKLGGVTQLVVLTREAMSGVRPDSGEVLWSRELPSFRGMHILTPVVHGNRVFTSPYRNGAFMLEVERGDDGDWSVDTVWDYKGAAYMSSPVRVGDDLYVHLGNGRVDCLDSRTGESRWRSAPLGDYWSMAVQGDRILALDDTGTLRLIRADAERYHELDARQVADQETWGHIAVDGDLILVRELEAVSAFRWPAP